jgi:hypothetical protein
MSKILLRRRLSKMRLKMGTILMIMMQMMVRMMMRVMERVRMKARKMMMKVKRRRRRRRRRNRMEGGDMISEIAQKSVGSLWRQVSKDHDLLEGYCIKEWEQRSIGM